MENQNSLSKEERIRRQSIERFLSFDQEKMIENTGVAHDASAMRIAFLGQEYVIDRKSGELSVGDRPGTLDEMASIYEFLTMAPDRPVPTGKWASIAQLCTNTTDTSLGRYIEQLCPFEDKIELMSKACALLGGRVSNKGDVSYVIPVMDGVDVWFQYWEKDDEFPASVQFLFDAEITRYFRWSILWNIMTCMTTRMKEIVGI